ncbi:MULTISPECIES: hypothetical protein [Methylomicrobium]|uniref:Uncharacterized protein n=1 Tax=Methylomicrobium album BG8 TaxID=686340 RepID=H8GKW8_METAL|nr:MULTISPECIES: hypothetical protein [Methylomicrobium]EIC29290.1 hypothetical protein Metal_1506 [Methylomicrobium album BG8]
MCDKKNSNDNRRKRKQPLADTLIPNAVKLSRHLGTDCRDPDYRDVLKLAIPGAWIPAFLAGMTNSSS